MHDKLVRGTLGVTTFSDCPGADLVTGMCVCDDGYVMEGENCIKNQTVDASFFRIDSWSSSKRSMFEFLFGKRASGPKSGD